VWLQALNARPHNLLKGNVAAGAGDDGFDVESRTTQLTGNRAVGNADLGIEAVRGVTDGGDNRASGNGVPRQCLERDMPLAACPDGTAPSKPPGCESRAAGVWERPQRHVFWGRAPRSLCH
jgi:hypothetical protein